MLGNGFVVIEASMENKIRKFSSKYWIALFIVLILSNATIGPLGIIVLAPVAFIIWPLKVRSWTKGLEITDIKRNEAIKLEK